MSAFEDIVLFLSAVPKFADAKVILKNNEVIKINKVVFCSYSRKILELVFCSQNSECLNLNDVNIKYFDILKKFIYQRNEFDKSEETVAYLILTSFIFETQQIQKFVSSIFKKVDPVKVFHKIKKFVTEDEINYDVVNNSYNFFVENIDTDMITQDSILKLGRESVKLLSNFLLPNKCGLKKLFDKYEWEIKDMLRQLSIFRNKETVEKQIGSKLNILKSYATNECVSICGYRNWFIYIVNWFFYCRDRNVDDFVIFLDCITQYDEICFGLINKVLIEFKKNLSDSFESEKCEYFVSTLNAIKKSIKLTECCCSYCTMYCNVFSLDNEEMEEFIDDNIDEFKMNYDSLKKSFPVEDFEKNISNVDYNEQDDAVSVLDSASIICSSIQSRLTLTEGSDISKTTNNSTLNSSIISTSTYLNDSSTLYEEESVYSEKLRIFNNSIFIFGGNCTTNSFNNCDIYLYDIQSNKCSVVNDISIGRKLCKIEHKDEKIFLFGGKNKSGIKDPSILAINLKNGEVRNMYESFSCGRVNHATIRQDNNVYIIGGELNDKRETVVKYDLEYEKKYTLLFEKPFEVVGHSLCEYQNSIYIFGGITKKKRRNMFVFDSRSKDGLVKLKSPPIPILKTSVVKNDNVLTSFGGMTFSNGKSGYVVHKEILQFDPRADEWIVCNLHCRRSFYSGGACCINEKFYTFGGYNSQNIPQKGIYVFDDGSWKNVANFPVPLADFDFLFFP